MRLEQKIPTKPKAGVFTARLLTDKPGKTLAWLARSN